MISIWIRKYILNDHIVLFEGRYLVNCMDYTELSYGHRKLSILHENRPNVDKLCHPSISTEEACGVPFVS